MTYTLYELLPGVFYALFKDHYTFTMAFLRSCEIGEDGHWKGKPFSLLEYMEWYAGQPYARGAFTYTRDWKGFHVDSDLILARKKVAIPDYNKYDQLMDEIVNRISAYMGSSKAKWSLIGTSEKYEKRVLNHELAHAFWALDKTYRKDMKGLVSALPRAVRSKVSEVLTFEGYTKASVVEETHAYAATGVIKKLRPTGLQDHVAPFRALFRSYLPSLTRKKIP